MCVHVYREQANVTKCQLHYSCNFPVDVHFFKRIKFFKREIDKESKITVKYKSYKKTTKWYRHLEGICLREKMSEDLTWTVAELGQVRQMKYRHSNWNRHTKPLSEAIAAESNFTSLC